MVRRTAQVELTIEDLDKELIARGAQIPSGELFKFEDTEGTPAREDMMEGVKELHEAASATSPNPALSSIDTWDLYRLIIHKTRQREENRKRGIWFEDNRMDFCGITDRKVQENVNCVAAIILKGDLSEKRNGKSTLKVKNYGKAFNMCETEPFRDQYVAAGRVCTGFLVKKKCHSHCGSLCVRI